MLLSSLYYMLPSKNATCDTCTSSRVCLVATYQGVSPRFIVRPVDKVVAEGATVVLFCAANGRNHTGGRPSVIWLKDGAALDLV